MTVEFGINLRIETRLPYVWRVGRGILVPTIHMTPYVHTGHVEELVSGTECVAVELDPSERARLGAYLSISSTFDASRFAKLLPIWVRLGRKWRKLPPQLFRLLVMWGLVETRELVAIDDEVLYVAKAMGRRVYYLEDLDEQLTPLMSMDSSLVVEAIEELGRDPDGVIKGFVESYYSGDFCRFVEWLRSTANGKFMVAYAEARDRRLASRVSTVLESGCLVAIGAAHLRVFKYLGVPEITCNKL